MAELLIFALTDDEALVRSVTRPLGAEPAELQRRRFPDGETYLRVVHPCTGRRVVVVADLAYPDPKIPALLFLGETLRELGALRIGLVVPYLPYMRQDKRFQDGEAVTSRQFARWLSRTYDWLVTVDPHLHRYPRLDAVYSIPAYVIHAAPRLADWIAARVETPLLIGPDAESEQWVGQVAEHIAAPYLVFNKQRLGDTYVRVHGQELSRWRKHTPVIVDDVIASGQTMLETIRYVRTQGLKKPICAAVHGIFAGDAYKSLLTAGAAEVVTCRTVTHAAARIEIGDLIARAVEELEAGVLP